MQLMTLTSKVLQNHQVGTVLLASPLTHSFPPCLLLQGLLLPPVPNMCGTLVSWLGVGGGEGDIPTGLSFQCCHFLTFSEPCNCQRVPQLSPWGRITSQKQFSSPGSLTYFGKEQIQAV